MNTQNLPLIISICSLLAGFLAELFAHFTNFGWSKRRQLVGLSLFISAFGAGTFAGHTLSIAGALLVFITVYRSINNIRIFEDRMNNEYLKNATKRSFVWLAGSQIVVLALWYLFYTNLIELQNQVIFNSLGLLMLCAGLVVLLSTIINILITRAKVPTIISDKNLPTVTLAIAARNENSSLQHCLESALSSDYLKLEIIVLDDCSQDKTAAIIKSFAHDGIRFVQGDEPNDTWLPKNLAYQKLINEASGDIILFAGVDTRMHQQTIRQLVEIFKAKNITMMSVMPKRKESGLLAAFIQPMRYFWELAIPRQLLKRPPVLSTCWLVDRKALLKMGGFKAVTRAIIPEEHFAYELAKVNKYAFIRNNASINLTTHKDFISQWLTAVRTRYPQMHRRPELVALRTLLMLVFLLGPFLLLGLIFTTMATTALAKLLILFSVLALSMAHILITVITNPVATLLATVNLPIVVILDFVALHISMFRYEFGEVLWKGRNVSHPAMHVVSHLPKVE